jgi:hypothetical protein
VKNEDAVNMILIDVFDIEKKKEEKQIKLNLIYRRFCQLD